MESLDSLTWIFAGLEILLAPGPLHLINSKAEIPPSDWLRKGRDLQDTYLSRALNCLTALSGLEYAAIMSPCYFCQLIHNPEIRSEEFQENP